MQDHILWQMDGRIWVEPIAQTEHAQVGLTYAIERGWAKRISGIDILTFLREKDYIEA